MTLELALCNAGLVLALMTAVWGVSVYKRDASIVDPIWSIAFLVITVNTAAQSGLTPAGTLLLAMVALWALRLCLHLTVRSWGEPEDPRYANFRQRFGPERYWWFSFFQVFLLQGCLALFISAPLQLAAAAAPPDTITAVDIVGLVIFAVGFVFEVVADWQLQTFRANSVNRGKVLDTGLWRLSRHPNYFGEAVLWWGFWVCALDQYLGWATVFAPLLMTFLLLKVSGVTLLDAQLKSTKPGYADYVRRTSALLPRPPRD